MPKKTKDNAFNTREEIFKNFFVSANEIILSIDKNGRFIFVNPAWMEFLGYSADEAKKMVFSDILIESQAPYWQKSFKKIIAGTIIKKYKTIFVTKKGEKIFVEGSLSTQFQNSKLVSVWGIFHDITKYRKSESEARKMYRDLKKRRFELEALKSLSDRLTNIYSIESAISSINSYLSEVLNFSAATYLIANSAENSGFVYITYVHEEIGRAYINEAAKDILKYLSEKKSQELKPAIAAIKNTKPRIFGTGLKNNSKARPRSKHIFPLEIGDTVLGAIQISSKEKNLFSEKGWLADAMVVTFMLFVLRIQALARSQHSNTESLIASLSEGVIMFNKKKDIILMNPISISYTGLSLESFTLVDFYKLFPDLDLDKKIDEMFKTSKIINISEAKLDKHYYELFITPVKDNEGKISKGAIIMHDISGHKEVEYIKSEFVSFASHQLRTPLTGIKWFSRLLLMDKAGKLNTKQKDFVEQISLTNTRMIKLVNDLLNVSRIETGRKFNIVKKMLNLSTIIDKIIEDNKIIADDKGIKLIDSTKPLALAKLVIDGNKIIQALGNLVGNAIKYSPKNSRIEIGSIYKDNSIVISVKDSGIGIPKKQQKRIFNKFFRADNTVDVDEKGTGLGLYLAKAIIEAHGGKIWFESIENKGTTFFVSLPC